MARRERNSLGPSSRHSILRGLLHAKCNTGAVFDIRYHIDMKSNIYSGSHSRRCTLSPNMPISCPLPSKFWASSFLGRTTCPSPQCKFPAALPAFLTVVIYLNMHCCTAQHITNAHQRWLQQSGGTCPQSMQQLFGTNSCVNTARGIAQHPVCCAYFPSRHEIGVHTFYFHQTCYPFTLLVCFVCFVILGCHVECFTFLTIVFGEALSPRTFGYAMVYSQDARITCIML